MPPKKSEADELAALYVQARAELTSAGRSMHDHIAPLLTAAGFRLQLARMDVPDAAGAISETLQMLDQAMDHLRALAQTLNPSPAYRSGLKDALLQLAEQHSHAEGPDVSVAYTATANLPVEIVAGLYQATATSVGEAVRQKASRIRISVQGAVGIQIRITDNGRIRGRTRNLAIVRRLACEAGIVLAISTRKSTIVSISYAIRRSTRR